jgi:Protein of unknown function (DUF3048) N-terminal domain/Protein of unknown function (DUF3048) C-terminal domain
LPISAALARRPVIAVMVDDQFLARPQSGFSSASVVWQAPAEGGIPRYMMLFQEGDPKSVGPVRSARLYFISWAAEWRAVYVHAGGSPQALHLLRGARGRGRVVYDADDFKYEGRYLFRTRPRVAPHNLYTDGSHLRGLARAVGAKPRVVASSWQFAPDVPVAARPSGGQIVVPYQENRIVYRYDRASNRYLRSVTNESRQTDAATKARVGPKNVVVMYVRFAPLRDGTTKGRLEARVTGSGKALISTNGKTVVGTWRKPSFAAPTLLFGRDGSPVTLTAGQTFVQVVPVGTKVSVHDGKPAAATASPTPEPTASPTAAPTGFDRSVAAAAI